MSVDAVIIRVSTSSILYVWAHDALCQAGEFVELGGVELILVAVLTVIPILTPSRAQIKSYAGTSSALTVLSKKVRKEKKNDSRMARSRFQTPHILCRLLPFAFSLLFWRHFCPFIVHLPILSAYTRRICFTRKRS